MKKLFEGLHRFRVDVHTAEEDLFARLSKGQSPEVLFITCSDSRVVPNLITQTKPGDLFVIRNAGNIVPPFGAGETGVEGTIEYAVDALGVSDVVICGHAKCGAVGAVLDPESVKTLPMVAKWLERAEPTSRIVRKNFGHLEGAALLTASVQANVLVQLANLKTHPSVAARLAKGDLNLHGWVYDFQDGAVTVYDPARSGFVGLEDAPAEPAPVPSPLQAAGPTPEAAG